MNMLNNNFIVEDLGKYTFLIVIKSLTSPQNKMWQGKPHQPLKILHIVKY